MMRRLRTVNGKAAYERLVLQSENLDRALDVWIASLPDPACTCFLKHRNTDGPVEVIDWECAIHGEAPR